MRIDLVITELDTGGAEKCCVELALFLSQRGHQVRVIAFGPRPESSKDSLVHLLESNHIKTHFLGGKAWWMFPKVLLRIRRLFKSDRPEVIQSFLWHANVISALVAPSLGIPFFAGIRVSEPLRNRHALDRWSVSRSKNAVCVSQGVADWCVQTEKMDARKLIVIPNGIATTQVKPSIDPESHNVPANSRVLLFVGRLEHQKGVDVIVQRAEELLNRLPDHHLVFIGIGNLRQSVIALAMQQKLKGRVHCLGLRKDVRAWMSRSELLLLPTRYEGMPNVILEAMVEGLPVVTTRAEGVAELLGEQLENQSVAREAWDDFFELAFSLANSPELRRTLSLANRNRAENAFALDEKLTQYEMLYCKLCLSSRT